MSIHCFILRITLILFALLSVYTLLCKQIGNREETSLSLHHSQKQKQPNCKGTLWAKAWTAAEGCPWMDKRDSPVMFCGSSPCRNSCLCGSLHCPGRHRRQWPPKITSSSYIRSVHSHGCCGPCKFIGFSGYVPLNPHITLWVVGF